MARATVDRLHRVPERVPLLEKDLGEYVPIVGAEVVERIQALAAPLRGCRVLHINATAYGGGVAELLATHVPLLRSVGIDADWQVLRGSDEFFGITKEVHNGLQGADIDWSSRKQRVYLEHVLDNALRVSPPQGKVSVMLSLEGSLASVSVSDRGPGIEPQELKRIFDRLYTRPRRTEERPGSGLGLAIARAIARDHGGELSARNDPGGGATFTLMLPIRSPAPVAVPA